MNRIKQIAMSVIIPLILVASIFATTTVVAAMSIPKSIGKILLISDSSDLGGALRNYDDNTTAEVLKQSADSLRQVDNMITAVDLNTYFNSEKETKLALKKFLANELSNSKVVTFFAENGYIETNSIYEILDIENEYTIGMKQVDSDSSETAKLEKLVGVSVEEKEGFTILSHFIDSNDNIINENEKLSWIVSNSLKDILSEKSLVASKEIETQRKVVGTGSTEMILAPIYNFIDAAWQSRLIIYLRRTKITNINTTTPTTEWTGTSELTISLRSGYTTNLQLKSVNITNMACGGADTMLSFLPGTTAGTTTQGYSITTGMNSQGQWNTGSTISYSVSYGHVKAVAGPFYSPYWGVDWSYSIESGTLVAKNGGSPLVQQIVYRRTSVGRAELWVRYNALFKETSGCNPESTSISAPYSSDTYYFIQLQDMNA